MEDEKGIEEVVEPSAEPKPKPTPGEVLQQVVDGLGEEDLKGLWSHPRVQSEIDRRARRDSDSRLRQKLEQERERLRSTYERSQTDTERLNLEQQWLQYFDRLDEAEQPAVLKQHPFLYGLLGKRAQGQSGQGEQVAQQWETWFRQNVVQAELESEEFQELPEEERVRLQPAKYKDFAQWRDDVRRAIREHWGKSHEADLSRRIEVEAKRLATALSKEQKAGEREAEPQVPVMPAGGSPGLRNFDAIEEAWLQGNYSTEDYMKARKAAGLDK